MRKTRPAVVRGANNAILERQSETGSVSVYFKPISSFGFFVFNSERRQRAGGWFGASASRLKETELDICLCEEEEEEEEAEGES